MMNQSELDTINDSKFHKILKWSLLIATVLAFLWYFSFLLINIFLKDGWVIEIMKQHTPITIGLPFSALSSLFLVLLLQYSSGQIEFKVLGFEFKGASGPIVFWIMCFMSFVLAIKILWNLN